MAAPQSDNPVERLVARSMRVRSAAPRELCPDADLVAAFAEGSLARKEARRVERHASSCSRCAHILSTILAQDPIASLRQRSTPWLTWGAWRWAAPMATAAIVAGVWLLSTPESLRTSRAPASVPAPARSADVRTAESKAAPPVAQAPAPPPVAQEPSAPRPAAPAAVSPSPRVAEEGFSPQADNAARASRAEVSDLKEPPALERASAEERLEPAAPAASQAEAPQASAAAPQARAATAAAPARRDAERPTLDSVAPLPIIPSPDPRTVWRGNGMAIERSTDGGRTWSLQYTADQPIRGGAAVSSDVAWFFGLRGLVLRRTIAGWSVATARPGDGEIASIDPGSPTEAIVTLADGRKFETRDGGVSWGRR